MVHEVSGAVRGKSADVTATSDSMARTNKKLLTNLAHDCGKTYEDVRKQLQLRKNADWYMTAREAKRFGLIDHVEAPRLIMPQPAFQLMNMGSYDQLVAEEAAKKKR
jgi:ATP-dependent protease ClpP protease subunit